MGWALVWLVVGGGARDTSAQVGPEFHADVGASQVLNSDGYSTAMSWGVGGTLWMHDRVGFVVQHRRVGYDCTREICGDVTMKGSFTVLGGRGRLALGDGIAAWAQLGAVLGSMNQGGTSTAGSRLAFELHGSTGLHTALGAEWRPIPRVGVGPWVSWEAYRIPFGEDFPKVVPMKEDADATFGRSERDDHSIRTRQGAAGVRFAVRVGG